MKTIAIGLALVAGIAVAAGAQQRADTRGARAAVEHYLKGHATGDPKEFTAAFHERLTLFWVDQTGTLMTRTAAEYIARAPGHPAPDENARKRRIVSLDVTRTAGMAKVELDYPDAHIVDYLSLLKIDGEWKVVNKIFTTELR